MTAATPFGTAEEYLRLELEFEEKHELRDGQIFAMAGARKEHNRIASALNRVVGNGLEGTPCEAFTADQRVRTPDGTYTYPGGCIACDPVFESEILDVLVNPVVIFEILSPSTEAYDRGDKFRRYQGVESLQDYVLLATERPRVEVFSRQGDGSWSLRAYDGLQAVALVPSLDLKLALRDLYARVFPTDL